MKKIALLTFISILTTSCFSSDDKSKTNIDTSQLPQEATNLINSHFSVMEILRVEKDTNSIEDYYEVKFKNGIEISFDQTGIWTEVDGNNIAIPTGFINSNIVNYVTTNNPTTSIEGISKEIYGFDVDLLNNIELKFNTEGTILIANP